MDLSKGECGILAFDARRHGVYCHYPFFVVISHFWGVSGKTTPLQDRPDDDLDIEMLTQDFLELLSTLFPDPRQSSTFLVRLSLIIFP